jgi:exosome complex component RRP4
LVTVQPSLVKRLKQHMVALPGLGIDVILGCNGYIWIARSIEVDPSSETNESRAEIWTERKVVHASTETNALDRRKISRVANAITSLSSAFRMITPETIMARYYEDGNE